MSQAGEPLPARMKGYEYAPILISRIPKIIRLDGRAFGSFLRPVKDIFDPSVVTAMVTAAKAVMEDIGGTARMAYLQSDECSIVLNDFLDLNTQGWFGNNMQKMVSVSSSIFTKHFGISYDFEHTLTNHAYFDSRVFALPDAAEVINYLVWRQQDGTRNSINKYGRSFYSHKEMEGLTTLQIRNNIREDKHPAWEDLETWKKRGVCIIRDSNGKFIVDWNIPIFTELHTYITNQYFQTT